ncbi:MAG: hypothetical protein FJY82_06020 [Candidatus Aminicenantes bacterium]|nr:hypothetical protein [Candidatus Aminicenantes bacterium]
MPEKQPKLEAYLEEISHFLSGRAERYAEDRPIIAPAYKRYLFRYTSILLAFHLLLTVVAVTFTKSFIVFPFLYVPEMGVLDALMYLPTAFLADLGVVALILYFVTQSGKDVKLPWPKIGADLDEIVSTKSLFRRRVGTAVGAVVMLTITYLALYVFARHQTIFFINFNWKDARPLFAPEAGRYLSLVVIAMFAAATIILLVKLFTRSRWVDVASNAVSLALIGLLLRQPFDGLFVPEILSRFSPRFVDWAKHTLLVTLLFIAVMVTIDLVKNLVAIGRKKWGT